MLLYVPQTVAASGWHGSSAVCVHQPSSSFPCPPLFLFLFSSTFPPSPPPLSHFSPSPSSSSPSLPHPPSLPSPALPYLRKQIPPSSLRHTPTLLLHTCVTVPVAVVLSLQRLSFTCHATVIDCVCVTGVSTSTRLVEQILSRQQNQGHQPDAIALQDALPHALMSLLPSSSSGTLNPVTQPLLQKQFRVPS